MKAYSVTYITICYIRARVSANAREEKHIIYESSESLHLRVSLKWIDERRRKKRGRGTQTLQRCEISLMIALSLMTLLDECMHLYLLL